VDLNISSSTDVEGIKQALVALAAQLVLPVGTPPAIAWRAV